MLRLTRVSSGPDETRALGEALGRLLAPGALVRLSGPLGAGKTVLAQGIAAGLGVRSSVVSPTFTLVREYEAPACRLVHLDFYRLSGPDEARDLGLEDYLAPDAVAVVEWPERAGEALPDVGLDVALVPDGPRRRITFVPRSAAYAPLVARLAAALASGPPGLPAPVAGR